MLSAAVVVVEVELVVSQFEGRINSKRRYMVVHLILLFGYCGCKSHLSFLKVTVRGTPSVRGFAGTISNNE